MTTGPNERQQSIDLAPPPVRAGHALGYALFLDVDGTLLEFANEPDGVTVAATLSDLLARVRRALQGALALISGRNLDTIDRFFAPHAFAAAGLHGLQLRDADGEVTSITADLAAMTELRAGMHAITKTYPALQLEDKGGSLALHYRQAPALAAVALDEARALTAKLGDGFVLQPGNHVIEIHPAGTDKGRALNALMTAPPFAGRVPVAIGDDYTDEHAFAAAEVLGGIGVIVGDRRPTNAGYAFPDPDAVHAWLREVLTELEQDTSA